MVLSTDEPTTKSWLGHMNHWLWNMRPDCCAFLALRPMPGGLGIQGRDQWLGCRGNGMRSGQNNLLRGNLPPVHMAVVKIVRTDPRAFEGDSGKQATCPRVTQDFGSQSRVRLGRRIAPDRTPSPGSIRPQLHLPCE